MNAHPKTDDLAFSFCATKDGAVTIFRDGTAVTVLRGATARQFLAKVGAAAFVAQQQLMARLTGNYKRGNEHGGAAHARNRGSSDA